MHQAQRPKQFNESATRDCALRVGTDMDFEAFDVVELEKRVEFVGFIELNLAHCSTNQCNTVTGCT